MTTHFKERLLGLIFFFKPKSKIRRIRPGQGEVGFLSGKHSRFYELLRVIRIAYEFFRGFWSFHFIGPAITVFGSARFSEDHPYYILAEKIGALIANENFVTATGGGPGIMEAANKGAKKNGGYNIGANIILPHEQIPNAYLDKNITFYYFFVRKVILIKYSYAFIVMPGGFGTLDEMTEALTLIQTGKLYDFPVILVGTEYWRGFKDWIENTLLPEGTISKVDYERIYFTDSLQEIQKIIHSVTTQLNTK